MENAVKISKRQLKQIIKEEKENMVKISKRQLKQIIKEEKQKLIKEAVKIGVYGKLNDDVTNSSMNLDQEVYFGLEQGVAELIGKFAKNPRYAKYGVTFADVLEELKIVLEEFEIDELE